MADFLIEIETKVIADNAIKQFNALEKTSNENIGRFIGLRDATKNLGEEFLQLKGDTFTASQSIGLSVLGIAAALKLIQTGTDNLVESMMTWTPGIIAAIAIIRLNFGMMARDVGEEVVPIFGFLKDVSSDLRDALADLPEEVQTLIGVFILFIDIGTDVALVATGVAIALRAAGFAAIGVRAGLLKFLGVLGLVILIGGIAVALFLDIKKNFDRGEESVGRFRIVLAALAIVLGVVAVAVFGVSIPIALLIAGLVLLLNLLFGDKLAQGFLRFTQFVQDIFPTTGELAEPKEEQPVPPFHSGGIFKGSRPGLAMLKPRERVLTETEQRSLGLIGGGGANGVASVTNTYNVTISGGTFTSRGARRAEAEMFAREIEKQNNTRGFI